jgi:hypothetical protein
VSIRFLADADLDGAIVETRGCLRIPKSVFLLVSRWTGPTIAIGCQTFLDDISLHEHKKTDPSFGCGHGNDENQPGNGFFEMARKAGVYSGKTPALIGSWKSSGGC